MTLEEFSEENPEALLLDGFEPCFVGACVRFGQETIAAYDLAQVIQTLRTRDGMTDEEAQEWFEFNIIGAWVGDRTPCFISQWSGV